MIRKLLLGLALVWAGYAALREINEALSGYDVRDRWQARPLLWRAGMPPADDLARFAASARPLLPAGSRVAFASPAASPAARLDPGADLFVYRWAAYLLPEVDLVEAASPAAARADYALGYRLALPADRFQALSRLPGGWLYRVRR